VVTAADEEADEDGGGPIGDANGVAGGDSRFHERM